MSAETTTDWIKIVSSRLAADQVSVSEGERYRHSHDESDHSAVEPELVCFPETTEDVQAILETARQFKVPVTAFGAGSGLEGQAIPVQKGISLNFERMNQVLHFAPEDLLVTVQPGITRLTLNQRINRHGLQFPVDPGADATIGGMAATNASGTTAVRYGVMRDQILDMEVVLADGSVIHTGTKAKKSSSGYSVGGLFTGSEGTLGIITEITLKLHAIPEHTIAASCTFDTPRECAEAANSVLLMGIPVQRMEFVDAPSIKKVNEYGGYGLPEKHSLFFEFAGLTQSAIEDAQIAEELLIDQGAQNWHVAADAEERASIWKARHEMAYAYRHQPGVAVTGGDVCVPISKLPDLLEHGRELIETSGLEGGLLGHIGDGNFHTCIVYDPTSVEQKELAFGINDQLAFRAIELGGTCTGEHGVGLGKRKFQETEHGAALTLFKNMKQMLDPHNILNPGKIFE
ncbi:FAD-linked oxidase C-terminal domain-containing protein [Planococcus sp. ISL-109]|uniref:FAD-binding oxidoreductase n=1 Tax=Planococcus sp. ISL-109 TaxID=2819166 RepID=UPI001BEAC44D|nr:FAD-linked oxidase C-terminal domain-containing protein [Planococcus sp. ISL-109]MBT2581652.1 FAD-binding protein [Planococcus sp. ISL-109]